VDIEDRLYPLDDKSIEQYRLDVLSSRRTPSALETQLQLQKILGRQITQETFTSLQLDDIISSTDRWLAWFKETLATCEEARRANRNFNDTDTTTAATLHVSRDLPFANGTVPEPDRAVGSEQRSQRKSNEKYTGDVVVGAVS
jgi:hypothetical protein